ncbi:YraN family protein, partial [Candidatus Dojkabacteria bacterium]|nr:YraN family protein [Candidatus Dojkabacteria bacterium]
LLMGLNYNLVQQNFRIPGAEIDLIFVDPQTDEHVFVEVKTSLVGQEYFPEERINYNQKRRILRASKFWLYKNNMQDCAYRIDVISVIIEKDQKSAKVRHLINAIY